MKKDRLFLLDETVVPASLTQLREVSSSITTQIVIFHFNNFSSTLVKEYLLSFNLFLSLPSFFLHSLVLPLHFS